MKIEQNFVFNKTMEGNCIETFNISIVQTELNQLGVLFFDLHGKVAPYYRKNKKKLKRSYFYEDLIEFIKFKLIF